MSEARASYRRILRSTSIIGGASFVNILIGVLRTKVLAVLLGPAGVGLTGLYTSLMSTAATFATMGVGTVGTRQIAEACSKDDARALAVARRSMFWGTMFLAAAGALVVWSFRTLLAVHVLGNASLSGVVGWLSIGVGLSVAGASQGALIQGMRRIGDMARLSVLGSVLNTVLGVGLLWRWGKAGLVAYVLVGPAMGFVLGHLYVSRLPKAAANAITLEEMAEEWTTLLRVGLAFVGAGLVGSMLQLWIRVDVGKVLGAGALGQYQAASTIATQYIGLILGAMGADYYPRLTGVIHNNIAASHLVNEQTEIAMLLSTPIFIGMMAMAPWIVHLLYSASFAPAIEVLRWQVLGDVLKVVSWPLGFVILAAGDGTTFLWTESAAAFVMAVMIVGLLPAMGLCITGISSLASYAFYLPLVYWLARRRIGFHWSRAVLRLSLTAFGMCAGVGILSVITQWGILLGCFMAVGFGAFALGRISEMSELGGAIGRLGKLARKITRVRAGHDR